MLLPYFHTHDSRVNHVQQPGVRGMLQEMNFLGGRLVHDL